MDDVQFKTPMSPPPQLGHLSIHSAYPFSDPELDQIESDDSLDEEDDDGHSVGGYSPPAWRRLGNGNRSSGFWRQNQNHLAYHGNPRQTPPGSDFPDEDVLEQAIRTRLPTGSLSPEKGRSPEPEARASAEDETLVNHAKSERGTPVKGDQPSKTDEDGKSSMMASMSPETVRDNCTFVW